MSMLSRQMTGAITQLAQDTTFVRMASFTTVTLMLVTAFMAIMSWDTSSAVWEQAAFPVGGVITLALGMLMAVTLNVRKQFVSITSGMLLGLMCVLAVIVAWLAGMTGSVSGVAAALALVGAAGSSLIFKECSKAQTSLTHDR
jgi:hypothetical protein